MNFKEKLNNLVGREWLYSPLKKNFTVTSWKVYGEDNIVIETREGVIIEGSFGNVAEFLKEFLPVEGETEAKAVTITRFNAPANSVFSGDTMGRLRDILMDNIEKVKVDKNFIPQAQTISENAKALIDMAKTEVELYKAVSSLKK